jgi:hypothetical protein
MMAIGHVDGRTWVIHDTAGGSWFGADGKRVRPISMVFRSRRWSR